jgi:hypothetical protein
MRAHEVLAESEVVVRTLHPAASNTTGGSVWRWVAGGRRGMMMMVISASNHNSSPSPAPFPLPQCPGTDL